MLASNVLRRCRFAIGRLLLAMSILHPLASTTPLASAATFDALMETMMEAQGAEATLLARQFGPDPANAIQFQANIDLAAGSFQFQTVPGSTYQGQPLQLSTVGSVDDQSSLWTIQSQGSVGPLSWSGSGEGVVDPPNDPDQGHIDWSWNVGGVLFDYHVDWQWHLLESFYISTLKAEFTINGKVVATGEGADALGESEWDWKLVGTNHFHTPIESRGTVPNSSFAPGSGFAPSTFEVRILPEPSTLALLAAGLLAAVPMAFRRCIPKHIAHESTWRRFSNE